MSRCAAPAGAGDEPDEQQRADRLRRFGRAHADEHEEHDAERAHRQPARGGDRFVEAREQQRPRDARRPRRTTPTPIDRREHAPAPRPSPKIEPNSTLTFAAPFAALDDVV